jgi:tetratricopeptide (TPR) repeat protein
MFLLRYSIAICICIFLGCIIAPPICSQQLPPNNSNETERGIKLYQQGNNSEAIKVLRAVVRTNKDDADAWYYLGLVNNRVGFAEAARQSFIMTIRFRPNFAPAYTGLAYAALSTNKLKEADFAVKKALVLGANNSLTHYVLGMLNLRKYEHSQALKEAEAAIATKDDFALGYYLKSRALILASKFKKAAENLEKFLQLNPDDANRDIWLRELKILHQYSDAEQSHLPSDYSNIYLPAEVTRRAQIDSKSMKKVLPEENYTDPVVALLLIIASDGTIKDVLVLQPFNREATQQAIKIVRKHKFIPAIKDGRGVSQFIQIELRFR